MRTKALLIAAAALAAGVITSQAQVYSQNIVGYVNSVAGGNYSSFALSLDLSAGNQLTNIFPNVYNAGAGQGPLDGDQVYLWNGAGFTIYTLDSTLATGLGDSGDVDGIAKTAPPVNPGQMIFFFNAYSSAITNTIVGTVHVDGAAAGTETVGTTTNIIGGNYQFVASKLPIAGGVSSVLGMTNTFNAAAGQGPLDGDQIYTPVIRANGTFAGYSIVTFDSTLSTGFGDSADVDGIAKPEPTVQVGSGFIFFNAYGSPYVWTQSL